MLTFRNNLSRRSRPAGFARTGRLTVTAKRVYFFLLVVFRLSVCKSFSVSAGFVFLSL